MTKGSQRRARQLAAEVEAVNRGIVDAVANATPEQWQRLTESERWPAGVVAHHVAEVQHFFAGVIAGVADVEAAPMELRGAEVDANNARHAEAFVHVGKTETLDALRANGAALAERIGELDDEQLARVVVRFDGQEVTADRIVALGVIAHFREHLGSLRQALAG